MKKISVLLIVITGIISLVFPAYSESFSLYGNLDDSNQYCNILIDYYYNLPEFDPFLEYVVFRNDQYKYTLVYGKDLTKDNLKYIQYTQSYLNNPSSLSTGSLSSLSLIKNNFTYVGNVEGSLTSNQFNEYKYKFLFIIGGFLFLLFFIYKIIKPRFVLHPVDKRYDL